VRKVSKEVLAVDPGTILLLILAGMVVFLVLDLLLTGGGMMTGMAGMMGSGMGLVVLLLFVIVGLLAYGLFALT
jgi:hypothetical protein